MSPRRGSKSDSDARALSESLSSLFAQVVTSASCLLPGSTAEIWFIDARFERFERVATSSSEVTPNQPVEVTSDSSCLDHLISTERLRCIRLAGGDRDVFSADDIQRMPGVQVICSYHWSEGPVIGAISGLLVLWSARTDGMSAESCAQFEAIGHQLGVSLRIFKKEWVQHADLAIARAAKISPGMRQFAEKAVNRILPQLFEGSAVSLFLVNPAKDRLDLTASTGIENRTDHKTVWYRKGEGLTGWVWEHSQPLRLPGDMRRGEAQSQMLERYKPKPECAFRSLDQTRPDAIPQLLILPLLQEGEPIGVLRLTGRVGNPSFSQLDESLAVEVVEDLANWVVHRAKLDQAERQHEARDCLSDELQVESNEQTALRLLLAAVTSGKGLSFNRAAVWLCDPEERRLEPKYIVGAHEGEEVHRIWEEVADLSIRAIFEKARDALDDAQIPAVFWKAIVPLSDDGEDVMNRAFHGKLPLKPLHARDFAGASPGTVVVRDLFRSDEVAVVPIDGNRGPLGILCADNFVDGKPIAQDDIAALQQFARTGGLALERIRGITSREVVAALQRRLVGAIVDGSDPDAMMSRVLDELCAYFKYERWLLYYHDKENKVVSVLGSRGFSPEDVSSLSFLTADTHAVAPKVVRSNVHHFTYAAETDPEIATIWKSQLKLTGPLLAYPLAVADTVTGVLVINDANLENSIVVQIEPFVNELVTAIRTVDLSRRLAKRDQLIRLMQQTQTAFVNAFADELWFLHVLAVRVMEITRANLCAVYRISPRSTSEQPVYSRVVALGYPNQESSDERLPATGENAGLVNHVLAGEPLMIANIAKDSRWSHKQQRIVEEIFPSEVRSFLGIPLRNRLSRTSGRPVGAIALTRARLSEADGLAFQQDDRTLVEGVATALSSFLTLKDAWRHLNEHSHALRSIHQISKRLTALTYEAPGRVDDLLKAIADQTNSLLHADLVLVFHFDKERGTFELPPAIAGHAHDQGSLQEIWCDADRLRAMASHRTPIYEEDIGTLLHGESAITPLLSSFVTEQEGFMAFAALPFIEPAEAPPSGSSHGPASAPSDLVGLMLLAYRRPHPFSAVDKLVAETLTSYAALALRSARGVTRIIQAREEEFEAFYSGLAHRLRNLLVTLPEALEFAVSASGGNTPLHQIYQDALDSANHAQRLVASLERLSRSRSQPRMVKLEAKSLVNEIARVVKRRVADKAAVTVLPSVELLELYVNRDSIVDDFRNFANDSLRHSAADRSLKVEVQFGEAQKDEVDSVGLIPGRYLKIVYADNGNGVPGQLKSRIFSPLFTTASGAEKDGFEKGLGMGLALARQTARLHGGAIRECGVFGEGVRFELLLPISKANETQRGFK